LEYYRVIFTLAYTFEQDVAFGSREWPATGGPGHSGGDAFDKHVKHNAVQRKSSIEDAKVRSSSHVYTTLLSGD
jgi:molecular chaperone DnaK (HSP70)